MSNYIASPINDEIDPAMQMTLSKIMELDLIKDALNSGGWIAGGFVRNVLLGANLADYLHWHRAPRDAFERAKSQGDIDIFFPSEQIANDVINRHQQATGKSLELSVGKFAMESNGHLQGLGAVKIQLVNHKDHCAGSIDDCLDRFDFKNCKVALNKTHFFYPEGWRELEATRMLKIDSTHSPFLGSRIVKYLNHRDMIGLTPDSAELMTTWLCRAATETFPGYSDTHLQGIKSAIMGIADKGFLAKEDLILFLGKWKKVMTEHVYGQHFTIEVDWALHKIEELDVKEPEAA
jgi:hypothetical protein